jgi:hypothetical protein
MPHNCDDFRQRYPCIIDSEIVLFRLPILAHNARTALAALSFVSFTNVIILLQNFMSSIAAITRMMYSSLQFQQRNIHSLTPDILGKPIPRIVQATSSYCNIFLVAHAVQNAQDICWGTPEHQGQVRIHRTLRPPSSWAGPAGSRNRCCSLSM